MKTNHEETYGSDDYSKFSGADYSGNAASHQRSDGKIYEDICETFANNSYIEVEDIEIDVTEGIVTLKGRVPTREMKREAEACLRGVGDIKDVFNLITLNEFYDQGSEGLVKHQSRLL